MAGLPWGLQKHAIWHVCSSCPHAPYNLLIAMVVLLIVGSTNVPFLMCTLEALQKYCSTGSLLLAFC